VGYIFRAQLLTMLDKGIGFLEPGENAYELDADDQEGLLSLVEDMKELPIKRDAGSQDEIMGSLSQDDIELRMDLRPFMQLDPCIISSTANVAKAYRLFQKMGLSHLYVAPSGPRRVVGVITRKDLTLENCQLQLGERASYEMRALRSRELSSRRSTLESLREGPSEGDDDDDEGKWRSSRQSEGGEDLKPAEFEGIQVHSAPGRLNASRRSRR